MLNVLGNIDSSKEIFLDLFTGSGIVGVNIANNFNYDLVIMNDACWQVIEILKYFTEHDFKEINEYLNEIKKIKKAI